MFKEFPKFESEEIKEKVDKESKEEMETEKVSDVKEYILKHKEKKCSDEDLIDDYFKNNYDISFDVRLSAKEKKYISLAKSVEKGMRRINDIFNALENKAKDFEKKNKKEEAQKCYEIMTKESDKVRGLEEKQILARKECKFEGKVLPLALDFDPITIAQQSEEAIKYIPEQHMKKLVKSKALVRIEQKLDYGNQRGKYIAYANGGVIRIFGAGRVEETIEGRRLEDVPDWKFTLVHEFGHSLIECLHSSGSKSDKNLYLEFRDLFEKEKDNEQRFFRDHAIKDKNDPLGVQLFPDEAFADSYALFILDPDKSKKVNPDFHNYMKEKIFSF